MGANSVGKLEWKIRTQTVSLFFFFAFFDKKKPKTSRRTFMFAGYRKFLRVLLTERDSTVHTMVANTLLT